MQKRSADTALRSILYVFLPVFIVVMVGAHVNVWAQSIYSAAGIGDFRYQISSRSAGMGGIGVALDEEIVYNIQNPAAGAFLRNTTVSSGFHFEGLRVSQSNSSFKNSLSRWSGFSFSVKIIERLGIAAGIVPFSDFNFDMELLDSAQSQRKRAEGRGGITRGFGGIAFKVTPGLALGMTVSRYFGQMEEEYSVRFVAEDVVNTINIIETGISGNNYRFGVYYNRRNFSAGGYYSLAANLTGESELIISSVLPPLSSQFPVRLPEQWGMGTSFRVTRGWILAADIQGNNFSNLRIGESIQKFRNGYQFAFGAEYTPERGINPSLLEKLAYRTGISGRQLYVQDADGSAIKEYTLGLGLGVPFNRRMSRMDIAVEIGTRGSKTADFVQERFMRVGISMGFREEWFQKGIDRRRPDRKPDTGEDEK